ncbi:MAG: ABC transporter substrate-binding protein [Deltaproteobacteria bacterium]|nr:ABC transporter substrate-binding protein [Deltaproteobacteria bacterium]
MFKFANVNLPRAGVLLACLLLSSATAAAQEKIKFSVGASSKTLGYAPLWVAWKHGFFEQQGLDAPVILLRGTPGSVQALVAGSIYVSAASPEAFIEVSERGLDTVLIGGVINGLSHFIMGGKNYRRFEDLRGATLGVSSLTSGTVTALKAALKARGLEYPRDYKLLVVAGGSSANLAALSTGQIAATTLAVPLNFVAEEGGFNVIGRLIDAIPDFQLTALAARRAWAEKNRPLLVRFMKGMAVAMRWLYKNKEPAVEFLINEMKLKPVHARKGWEYYTENRIWHPDGDLNHEGLKFNVQIYAEQSHARGPLPDPAKYVNTSYLKEALKELGSR